MKLTKTVARNSTLIVASLALTSMAASSQAQSFSNFNSGSTGTVDLIITSNTTIQLPSDGILHYRNITIDSGTILTFSNNTLNTPAYLLASGNVLINGVIDVSGKSGSGFVGGKAGPGGFEGGFGGQSGQPAGSLGYGKGPGGGNGRYPGNFQYPNQNSGYPGNFSYGNSLCAPLIGGSGGAGGPLFTTGGCAIQTGGGGGGGGGAILIAANGWITNNGTVSSLGGNGGTAGCTSGGPGSSGAIRLVAPLVSGRGILNVAGTSPGRVRIDSANREATFSLLIGNAISATRGSQGFVFPKTNLITLVGVTAGTNTYSLSPTNPAFISLPAGQFITSANVEIRADGEFYGAASVPIAVVVTPENGPSYTVDSAISLSNRVANVTVTIPTNTTSTIHAWTRQ